MAIISRQHHSYTTVIALLSMIPQYHNIHRTCFGQSNHQTPRHCLAVCSLARSPTTENMVDLVQSPHRQHQPVPVAASPPPQQQQQQQWSQQWWGAVVATCCRGGGGGGGGDLSSKTRYTLLAWDVFDFFFSHCSLCIDLILYL